MNVHKVKIRRLYDEAAIGGGERRRSSMRGDRLGTLVGDDRVDA